MKNKNYISISINNLLSNVDLIKKEYHYQYYILDVSNDAFFHGMKIISYLENEFDYLYAHDLKDVLKIRKYNKKIPIIYNGIIHEDNLFDLIVNNAILIISDIKIFEEIISQNIKDNLEIILNIDVDGYNGIDKKEDILNILVEIKKNIHLKILGVQSFITEDTYQEFKHIISPLKDLELVILNHEHDKDKIKGSNAIRLSSSIYGINPVKKALFKKEEPKFLQVLALNSMIINIKRKPKHKKECYIGVIPFGIIHGMNQDINKVFINNQFFSIIEVFENYSIIEIDGTVKIGDVVKILSGNNLSICKNIPIVYECNDKEQALN